MRKVWRFQCYPGLMLVDHLTLVRGIFNTNECILTYTKHPSPKWYFTPRWQDNLWELSALQLGMMQHTLLAVNKLEKVKNTKILFNVCKESWPFLQTSIESRMHHTIQWSTMALALEPKHHNGAAKSSKLFQPRASAAMPFLETPH